MKANNRKRLYCGGYVQGSIALRQYPLRKDYVRDLVRRLDRIPQILPLKYREQARTRGDHSRNIVRILDQVGFPAGQSGLRGSLRLAAMLHDIGHAMHGHASERAINTWAGQPCFSNDAHSARLIYHVAQGAEHVLPVFATRAFAQLADLRPAAARPIEMAGSKSRVLEFLDDLENAIGDTGDLVRHRMACPATLSAEVGGCLDFHKQETPTVAASWLHRHGFDGSYGALLAMSEPSGAASQSLRQIRSLIEAARLSCDAIARADAQAEQAMVELCDHVAGENPGRDLAWLIDVVATTDLEYVE
ncbi:HD domain-containing protein [Ralstonia solanacearum]|uniref:HD domain-containing protein n=1 Tax=Ralstonia solanacearum K60 TaxID=1091042 RepID=A0AAP7ZKM8_RALSL|nr:HD domain-containing protein [Ralstonia solanacearum]MBT1537703.1 HD domain-containing protein [Ralstonia solanacearum]OYQ12355.1 hypothetical protein B7R77_03165 [Ralstonia solanacearum K60]QOK82682.1 HD domain-containing protein [Ralstonia solanacearum]RIJ88051.1 HD domain-containing protein [Ralstonia solanacearum]CCF96556.1 hypothethical protein [Ralstonia solanacearum K60]